MPAIAVTAATMREPSEAEPLAARTPRMIAVGSPAFAARARDPTAAYAVRRRAELPGNVELPDGTPEAYG
jgi:hypothetical protein